ncbi:hypothetical protein ABPG75_012170 [Micractinium tetrahymenae]
MAVPPLSALGQHVQARCFTMLAPAGRGPLHRGTAARRRPLLPAPLPHPASSSSSSAAMPAPDSSRSNGAVQPDTVPAGSSNGAGGAPAVPVSSSSGGLFGWLKAQQQRSAELRAKLATLGLAAVLAYGLFDGISYTIAFSLAFLGYEAQTGLNPTQNVADIVKICILMWAGNNVTRPFRLAGAAALAPFMDKFMERLQTKLKLKSKAAAFALLVASVAAVCFSILGGLFFSRWVRG